MTLDRDIVASALPGYEIGHELGRGAWGLVLEGRHRQLAREVAIKQLPRAFAADPHVRARFNQEARLLASLDHPHIVPIYDYVERDGLCVLVMEKLPGGTVWNRFTSAGMTMETACAVAIAVASALDYAHKRGVLHRDVKPENMMFSGGGILKMTDFGIAKVVGGRETMATRAGQVLGTPVYMSPEQARGAELDPRTDVYSAGIVLYELLAGRLPFPEDPDLMMILYRRVHEMPVPLSAVADSVPRAVADATMRALATAPEDRYASAEDFGIAIAEAAAQSWGPGWLGRADLAVMGSGSILARVQPPPAPVARRSQDATVFPATAGRRRSVSAVGLDHADLVPIRALTGARAEDDRPAIQPGTRLGGFVVKRQVGVGGMATVYRAVQERLEREVALKVLSPALGADDAFVRRFHREAINAARLEHRHIVPVYDAGEDAGYVFLVMKLIEGRTLKEFLDGGPMDPAEVVRILRDVAQALDHAHGLGFIHRDVKPGNILVGDDRHVYLSDFGITRTIASPSETSSGQWIGTVKYMAPERTRGHAVDHRSDLYSLGCVAFECLTGKPPYVAEDAVALAVAHAAEPVPRLTERNPQLPLSADAVVMRSLAKDPAERYDSGRAFVDALERALDRPVQTVLSIDPARVTCPQCANRVEAGQTPCPSCKANIAACRTCSGLTIVGDAFCQHCGSRLNLF